jgi:subtilase family serine protease
MRLRPALAALVAAGLTTLALSSTPASAAPAAGSPAAVSAQPAGATRHAERTCAEAVHGAACFAQRLDGVAQPAAAAALPAGYGPADLQSAYKLPAGGSGATIAIVDAYDDPNAEADLAVYRSTYGLPACTTANGCFRKVDQNGGTTYPKKDAGWATEISLDLDMVSATCPSCHILLVEAKTPSFANLGAAVNRAAALGATAISNSYGGSDASDASYGSYYNHPGHAITVSSGDAGYGAEYPASSTYVVAVGGTSLTRASGTTRGWTEKAWSGAGSGCSAYNAAIPSAASFGTGCARRAVADVSAVADPNTGVAVYDSIPYQGYVGWQVYGGTSASAPIIASVYGLAGNATSIDANDYPYQHSSALFDVTTGSNGSCPTTQWCKARTGWDGPTGLGTPNGTGAF